MSSTPHAGAAAIKAFALEEGFDLAGVSRPTPSPHAGEYHAWIAANKQGDMHYLARNVDERLNLQHKFPWARSILSVALAYWQDPPAAQSAAREGTGQATSPAPAGKIARYAWGRDYHKVFESRLHRLERRIRVAFADEPELQIRAYSDTGPLLEREIATRAGLGWIGKHTLLIHPRHGSWFLLGELVLSLELEPDAPVENHCGTCTRCIDACPTAAISPYSLDASRCISYLTLEHKGEIPEPFHEPMRQAGYLVGCDICQEVCPFNRKPLPTREPDFAPRLPAPAISLQQVLAWQEQDWDGVTRGSAARRAKFLMWQRTAKILSP